jgi:mannose/fructose-specific phosphotransferase system component IIA
MMESEKKVAGLFLKFARDKQKSSADRQKQYKLAIEDLSGGSAYNKLANLFPKMATRRLQVQNKIIDFFEKDSVDEAYKKSNELIRNTDPYKTGRSLLKGTSRDVKRYVKDRL